MMPGVYRFRQRQSLGWFNGFYSVNSRRFLALVVLRHPSHGQQLRRPGAHQQPLQPVDCPDVAPFSGSEDAFL
jgi:hypothetical protein